MALAGNEDLVFKPKERFNMATDYSVDVPADTVSASLKGKLDSCRPTGPFRTPPPSLTGSSPQGDPPASGSLILLTFDQPGRSSGPAAGRVGRNEHPVAIGPGPGADAGRGDPDRDREVALRPASLLPPRPASRSPSAGLVGKEGLCPPLKDQSFGFTTYGPFRMTDSGTTSRSNPCRPDTVFQPSSICIVSRSPWCTCTPTCPI